MSLYLTSKATHTGKRRNIFEGLSFYQNKRKLLSRDSRTSPQKVDSPQSIYVFGRYKNGEMCFFCVLLPTHLPKWPQSGKHDLVCPHQALHSYSALSVGCEEQHPPRRQSFKSWLQINKYALNSHSNS